jgi:hypothetical protein
MEIINSLNITPQSKVNYRNLLKILERDGYSFKSNIHETVQFLASYPIRTAYNLLNVIFVIRKALGENMEKYAEVRSQMSEELQTQVHQKLSDLQIMSSDSFLKIMNQMYSNKEYLKYILNYLCFYFGVRNEDLRLNIGQQKDNFLLKTKEGIIYVRQIYKTVATYGIKRHIITDKKFIDSYDNLPNGEIYSGKIMSNFLKKQLILPENLIFKMRIKELEEKGERRSIIQLSESRGTALETVLNSYNINNKKYVIKK